MSAAEDDKIVSILRGRQPPPPRGPDDGGANSIDVLPEYSDIALAGRFTRLYSSNLRYVALWGKWMEWTGTHWKKDETLSGFDHATHVCTEAAKECQNAKVATSIANARTVRAVETIARAHRAHAATVDQWDRDEWLLNTPQCVIDLRTGATLPHDSALHMSKITAVAPGGNCPRWMRFLNEITRQDKELQAYLQRVAGYALTGSIREHAMFFGYGTGRNGKGTFLNTLCAVMGDYALTANVETFTTSATSRHLTELARLQGARLVVAQETEEGRNLAEARIKSITGGDPVTANYMRQDHFTYTPQFKLFIAGNHKPTLKSVDVAIRRRLNMIPFTVSISAQDADKDLPDKLRAEWPGILAWAIAGCQQWFVNDLRPPASVVSATEGYFSDEDLFGQWVSECCTTRDGDRGLAADLYASWKKWSAAAGEPPVSQKRFGQNLASRGYAMCRGSQGQRMYQGIDVSVPRAHAEPREAEYDY